MQKIQQKALFFLFISTFLFLSHAHAQFDGGTGSPDDPWQVASPGQLLLVGDFLDAHFIQTANIDMAAENNFMPIAMDSSFSGSFNGNGYVISNLTINRSSAADINIGLFSELAPGAVLDNITIENADITGYRFVGILAGRSVGGAILNSWTSGSVAGMVDNANTYAGGIAGFLLEAGTIENSGSSASVFSGFSYAGGLVGLIRDSGTVVSDSWASGDVTADRVAGGLIGQIQDQARVERSWTSGNVLVNTWTVGGFVGTCDMGCEIIESYASGSAVIDAGSSNSRWAGGFAGLLQDNNQLGTRIVDSYTTASVTGATHSGGFIGRMRNGSPQLLSSFAAGTVTGDHSSVGGFIGNFNDGTLAGSYWDIEASGKTGPGAGSQDEVTGLITSQMTGSDAALNMTGLDFDDIWRTSSGYPELQWQETDEPVDPLSIRIIGDAGWRMLSPPVAGITIADLAAQNLVQGVTGANSLYHATGYGEIEFEDNVTPNLFHYHPDQALKWQPPVDFNSAIASGQGFIWYFYDNNVGPSNPLDDFTLTATGTEVINDVDAVISDGFNLVGNPFAGSLDLSGLASWGDNPLSSAIAHVWDNSGDDIGDMETDGHTGSWRMLGTTGADGELASVWQGFFIENMGDGEADPASLVTIPVSALTQEDADFYKQQAFPDYRRISFELRGHDEQRDLRTLDRAVSLVFHPEATEGWDPFDATKLVPLTHNYATLSFIGEQHGNMRMKAQESRPLHFEGTIHIPVAFSPHNLSGDFIISWDGVDGLPGDWHVELIDNGTGISVDLRQSEEYGFAFASNKAVVSKQVDTEDGLHPFQIKAMVPDFESLEDASGSRFTVVVGSDVVHTEIQPDLPKELVLHQNYPNPFNPSTSIRYDVPEGMHVKLSVYNVLGQLVATPVNEQKDPGRYEAHFDAGSLSSGLYIYRLQAGSSTLNRTMMLLK